MTGRVELVSDSDCPNVSQARSALLQAFAQAGVPASWMEWDRKAPGSPAYIHGYGSPTILVNGKDVAGGEPGEGGDCCRLYSDGENGFRKVPPVHQIVAALMRSDEAAAAMGSGTSKRFGWRGLLAVLPGVGASLLPVATCPACWSVYTGLLGTIGFGFLLDKAYLLPIAVILLGLTLASLAYRARSRRGHGLLSVGIVGASIALAGKFALSSNPLLYLGLALLVGASLWNSWPRRAATRGSCAACAPQGLEVQPSSAQ
ncbi:MAG: MerC family mercury resistance protein [Candidatus Binatia bacterium]